MFCNYAIMATKLEVVWSIVRNVELQKSVGDPANVILW